MLDELVRQIYTSLLCVWENGGVYSDMKGENVMVTLGVPLEESMIKLVDLGSICTEIGKKVAIYTYPPPSLWSLNPGVKRGRASCTEKTLIWSMAIAVLTIYFPYYLHSLYHGGFIPNVSNLVIINHFLEGVEKDIKKVAADSTDDSLLKSLLNNVSKCFAPFSKDRPDWRTSDKMPAPFQFDTMVLASDDDDEDDDKDSEGDSTKYDDGNVIDSSNFPTAGSSLLRSMAEKGDRAKDDDVDTDYEDEDDGETKYFDSREKLRTAKRERFSADSSVAVPAMF